MAACSWNPTDLVWYVTRFATDTRAAVHMRVEKVLDRSTLESEADRHRYVVLIWKVHRHDSASLVRRERKCDLSGPGVWNGENVTKRQIHYRQQYLRAHPVVWDLFVG